MVRREALIAFAVVGMVAIPTSSSASAGARLATARSLSSHLSRNAACERHRHRKRKRCRRAQPRLNPVEQVAPGLAVAPAPKPDPNPEPGDVTPPQFAGLQSAFACTPGPQRPGQTTPFNLSWEGATDDLTPPAMIVYDIFVATEPGGEDFAHPNWTTEPGATSFRTPGLSSHGSFYFVVRARDAAGNEDANLVERHGVDPCY